MLSDVDMDALTVQSELPLDWGACVKLLGHTRFVSRLLKLTRGTLKVHSSPCGCDRHGSLKVKMG